MKIIGIGDNMVDVYLHEGMMYPGGNSVNVAVLCKKAGADAAAYMGIFGDDAAGKLMYDALTEEGLDLSRVRIVHGPNPKNAIELNEENDRTWAGNNYNGALNSVQLLFNKFDIEYIAQYDVLHTSSHSELPFMLPLVKDKIMVSMDFSINYTDDNIARLCPYLDFAFFSCGGCSMEHIDALIEKALKAGTKNVIITMGMDGSIATDGKTRVYQPAIPATEPVIDTLGAGDTYAAAFLLEFFNTRDLAKATKRGAEFALTALVCHGAFGHATPMDPSGLIRKDSPEYCAEVLIENRGF